MASVLDLVKHYQHGIEKNPNDEQRVLRCISKLHQLGVTVQHLQDTGVGRTVNALRKEPGDVGTAAKALVNKWKLMVAAEESSEPEDNNHDATKYNGQSGRNSDDNINQSRHGDNENESQYKTSSKLSNHRHSNGDYNSYKRKNHSSEDDEYTNKKARHSHSSEDEKYGSNEDKKMKSDHSSDESDNDYNDEGEDDDHGNIAKTQSEDSDVPDESEDEPEVKPVIKREYTNKETTRKHSFEEYKREDYKKPSSSTSNKSEHEGHIVSKHRTPSEKLSANEKYSSTTQRSSSEKKKSENHKIKTEKEMSTQKPSAVLTEKYSSSSDKYKSSTDKHKSHKSERHSSKFDGQSDHVNKSEKDKHGSADHKDKKLKDQNSSKESSSKNRSKHSSEKDKERLDREKEKIKSKDRKSYSHENKDEKRSSSSDSKSKSSDNKSRSNKADDSSSEKHSKRKSSSSSSHKSSSSSKVKEEAPKKKKIQNVNENSEDGIDCGSGASFAEALGMISPVKAKKKIYSKESTEHPTNFEQMSPAALLAPTAKLAPLPPLEISALPEISPNYKPRPPPKLLPYFSEEETMGTAISSKNQRTKVYSGNKSYGILPTLYELCVQVLQDNIDALEYTGGVPYDILKPVVDKATPNQLFTLEHHNPYLMEDTDHLWQKFCEKHFRNKKRQEMETWREMYMRCQEEQEYKLKSLTANIKMAQDAKNAPVKQTKIAYVDSVVKPPRNIARKQAIHGTARMAAASPAARVAALAGATNVVRAGTVRPPPTASIPSSSIVKPKKAPLMQKALQFMRGRKR